MAEEAVEVDNLATQKDTQNVSFSLPKDLFEKLSKEAEEEDRNISQQVRRIVRLYYEPKPPVMLNA